MSTVSDAWSWRHAIVKSDLPSPTRHLLLTLSIYMNEAGGSCYPSVEQIIEMTGLTKNTVIKHLKIAVGTGWLGKSHHGFRGQKWRRQEYVATWPGRDLQGAATDENGLSDAVDPDQQRGAADAPRCDEKVVQEMTEGGASAGTKVVQEMHQDKNSPITTPLTSAGECERASAVDEMGGEKREGDEQSLQSRPVSSAEMEKRVMRFCTGEGYQGGEWPKWTGSSLTYIKRRFADLSTADQDAAERWRDAFLAKCASQGVKTPMPVGNYFRDHAWLSLSETEMARAVAARERATPAGAAAGGIAEAARPEGWAVAMGPVWSACLHQVLLKGPEHAEHAPDGPLWLSSHLSRAWPRLAGLHQMASMKRGVVLPQRLHELKDRMEFVPEGCGMWAAWEAEYKARGWPLWPRHDGMKGMYFPRGGPEELAAFEALLTPQKENAA